MLTGDSLEDRVGILEQRLADKLAEFNSAGKEKTGAAASFSLTYFPEDGDSLYFVATGLGDGSHAFSATKDEHDRAVRAYLARLREQRSRSE